MSQQAEEGKSQKEASKRGMKVFLRIGNKGIRDAFQEV